MAVKCNNCEWTGNEEDLILIKETKSDDSFKACPNCKTDAYLQNIETEPTLE